MGLGELLEPLGSVLPIPLRSGCAEVGLAREVVIDADVLDAGSGSNLAESKPL